MERPEGLEPSHPRWQRGARPVGRTLWSGWATGVYEETGIVHMTKVRLARG